MTISNINVEEVVERVKAQVADEQGMSAALKASLDLLLLLVSLLINRLGLNSKNSSTPPSADRNRVRKARSQNKGKPGGQHGHGGSTLQPVAEPDEIKNILVDRNILPPGAYREVGCERRQVIDLDISRVVTEWRAQILEGQGGKRYVAAFPEGVTRPVQYGNGIKINAVYMSQYQLIPYNRIEDHFGEQLEIPVSAGSIYNFNQEAYERLEYFEQWVKQQLIASVVLHADETGINIGGVRKWLHTAVTAGLSFFYPHDKRGTAALEEMGVLPAFRGIICHDHWKPYYSFGAAHALCNAHHLRELERAWEQDKQVWAQRMALLLQEINMAIHEAGGSLNALAAQQYRKRYREVLQEAEKECPAPDKEREKGRTGRIARSKARNLLERLRDFENDVLRFMENSNVPFTNNQAENDLRMSKVQQKISGCFRSFEGAKIFCRVRSYLCTCRKQGVTATKALRLLFEGKWPDFMSPNCTQVEIAAN